LWHSLPKLNANRGPPLRQRNSQPGKFYKALNKKIILMVRRTIKGLFRA
jgi:hypothetical protein